MNPPIGAI